MTLPAISVRLELAHGLPRVPREAAVDGGPEAFARARLVHEDVAGGLFALRRWPTVATLGDVASTWRWEPLPDLLEGLLSSGALDAAERFEVHAPAEVQNVLRRRAPRTWQLLVQRTRLVQRDEAWAIERDRDALRVLHLPAGADSSSEVACPLLSLAARLRDGALLAAEARGEAWERAGHDEVRRLLRELLRARWLHRRLPPGIRWNAGEGSFDLRHAETRPRAREDFGDGLDGIPRRLFVQSEAASAQLEIDCDPGGTVPLPVVRAGLRWLLDPARAEESLVLTPEGRFPRE